jgi:hypothetical protein
MGGRGLDSSSSWRGPVAGSCEHGNEYSGSTERGKKFLTSWGYGRFLKELSSMELVYFGIGISTRKTIIILYFKFLRSQVQK